MTRLEPRVVILLAAVNSGKTTFCRRLFKDLRSLNPGGMVQVALDPRDKRRGYALQELRSGASLTAVVPGGGPERWFSPVHAAFKEIWRMVDAYVEPPGVLIVDELSFFELEGEGHAPYLNPRLRSAAGPALWVFATRDINTSLLLERFEITPSATWTVTEEAYKHIKNGIMELYNEVHHHDNDDPADVDGDGRL